MIRDLAENNPLRWQALDRCWDRIVLRWAAEHSFVIQAGPAAQGTEVDA